MEGNVGAVFPKEIITLRLRLRQPRANEASDCSRRLAEAYATRSRPLTDEMKPLFGGFMVEHWRRYGFGFFVVELKGERTAIGSCGLKYSDAYPEHWPERFDGVELGYSLLPQFRGFGYATESVEAVLFTAFEALDVPVIQARCDLDNDASADVLKRCGLTEKPSDRQRRFEMLRPNPRDRRL
jgi:RimJ/RimL family protein N-acetyltransferase